MQQFLFIILTFVYSSTCFGHFPAHHQELNDCSGSLWFYLRIVVPVVPTQHDCHTPETCWASYKRQDNKLENCCIWLMIYLNCTMMYRLTNLKFYICYLVHMSAITYAEKGAYQNTPTHHLAHAQWVVILTEKQRE